MRLQIDLPETVLSKIKAIAKRSGNSRKKHIEYILIKYSKDFYEYREDKQTDIIKLINELKKSNNGIKK